jgi:hypothetical protein
LAVAAFDGHAVTVLGEDFRRRAFAGGGVLAEVLPLCEAQHNGNYVERVVMWSWATLLKRLPLEAAFSRASIGFHST